MDVTSTSASHAWVRRCSCCRTYDLHAAFGSTAAIGHRAWACENCGSAEWVPVSFDLPTGTASGRCPILRDAS